MMKNLLLFLIAFTGFTALAQDYSFLSPASRKAKSHEYVNYLNDPASKKDSLFNMPKYYLENGKEYDQEYRDSISKSDDRYKYITFSYRDTLTNQFSFVLHKQTPEELEKMQEYWKNYSEEDKKNRNRLMGSVINNLTLTDMDGNIYTIDMLKGKAVVIDFWFVTCAACIEEMPELNKIKQKYGTEDVAWFGITFDNREQTERFLKRRQFDFTIIPDCRQVVDRFNIKFFPTTLVLDENHKVVYTGDSGPMLNAPKDIEKALKKVVKQIQKDKKKHKEKNVVSGPAE